MAISWHEYFLKTKKQTNYKGLELGRIPHPALILLNNYINNKVLQIINLRLKKLQVFAFINKSDTNSILLFYIIA